jgi:hypothetical protein
MDWERAIEWNRQALMRVLAMLVAMAGLAAGEPGTLPRHLHRAVLRLLRPAEAAARRLVIAAARGLVVTLPQPRPRKPKPASIFVRNGVGTGIVLPAGVSESAFLAWAERAAGRPGKDGSEDNGKPSRPFGFRLFDPLPRFRPARPAQRAVPRISTPGFTRPVFIPVRPPLSPDDPVTASRLALRIAALGRMLDDLPRQARRFALWRARLKQRLDRERESPSPLRGGVRGGGKRRTLRIWPLRPGRPPGLRRASDEGRQVLENTHGLALMAMAERRDTS